MKVAAVQVDVAIGAVERNAAMVRQRIAELGEKAVEFAVFPECVLSGYCFESRAEGLQAALPLDSDIVGEIAAEAERCGVVVALGLLERDGDAFYNAQVLLAGGRVAASYRKVHLPGLGVDCFVDPGNRPYEVHDIGPARIGMAICYDSSFPESIRVLGLGGADIIALSTNWPTAALRTAAIVPPARSMENHLFFIAANRVGTERGFNFCGNSSIAGPDGIELARASENGEELLLADIDPKLARNKTIVRTPGKHQIDRFEDRRPEFYGKICEPKEKSPS